MNSYKANNEFSSTFREIHWRSNYLEYAGDALSLPMTVTRWDISDWMLFAGVMGLTMTLYQYDRDIHQWTQLNRNHISNSIARYVEPMGGSLSIAPAGILYVYGTIAGNSKATRVAQTGFRSVITAGFITASIKELTHRHRPNSGTSFDHWDGPRFSTADLSFPSGHSAAAFAMATVFANEYKDTPAVAPLAYGLASMTALSRINDNQHWASDVFLGSVIGYFSAKSLMAMHAQEKNSKYVMTPVSDGRYVGITLSLR